MLGIQDVKELLTQTDARTLTLFVDVDNAAQENQAARPAWQIWVSNLLDEYGRQQNIPADVWEPIQQQVRAFAASYEPSAKTLVLFAGPDEVQSFELPTKVENQAFFGQPQIGQLLWMIDEYEPYLVVMVDQEKAKFFVSYLGSIGFQAGMETDVDEYDFEEKTLMPAAGSGPGGHAISEGSLKDVFQDTLNEHRARFYREIVERTDKLAAQHSAERIVLGGSEQSAHAVQHLMPDHLKAQVVGLVGIPMYLNSQEILEKVLPLAQEFERKQEFELVDQVINFARSGGRGALGYQAVEEAFAMQRVETLVLVWPFADEARDNDLAFRALQLNSGIELVHGDAASLIHDEGQGVGARLYYVL